MSKPCLAVVKQQWVSDGQNSAATAVATSATGNDMTSENGQFDVVEPPEIWVNCHKE